MLSPAMAVTTGALAVAIGGAVLIAQPFRQASVIDPGADAGPNALVLEDGTGDFHALADYGDGPAWVETRGPADADLARVSVSVEGDRLLVRFETAGPVPQVPNGVDWAVYKLLIDTDGIPGSEYETWHSYADSGTEDLDDGRWYSQLAETTVGGIVERGEAEATVVDGAIVASVGLDALPVAPSEMRFAASVEVPGGFDDTNNVFNWTPIDRAPDDENAWMTLGVTSDS